MGVVRRRSERQFVHASRELRGIPVGTPILEVLRTNGHDVPFSCEAGSCGSCRTKLISGDVDHRDFVLSEDEHDRFIMVCVSRGRGGEVEIDR